MEEKRLAIRSKLQPLMALAELWCKLNAIGNLNYHYWIMMRISRHFSGSLGFIMSMLCINYPLKWIQ